MDSGGGLGYGWWGLEGGRWCQIRNKRLGREGMIGRCREGGGRVLKVTHGSVWRERQASAEGGWCLQSSGRGLVRGVNVLICSPSGS